MAQNRLSRGVKRSRPLVAWAEVAGEQLARTTRAVALRDGVLIVEAQDAIAANFLTMQREMFLERYRALMGDAAPSELRFQMGVFDAPKAKPERKPSPLSRIALPPEDRARIEDLLEEATPEAKPSLRRAAETLARVQLERRALGWKPCPVCGTLAERPGPCPHCRNTMKNPVVQHASKLLVRNPDALLENAQAVFPGATEDALACAKFLALEYLLGQFEVLLLKVLQAKPRGRKKPVDDPEVPEMRLYLELTAKAYLALKLQKPLAEVTRRDRLQLPERVRNVLEATEPS